MNLISSVSSLTTSSSNTPVPVKIRGGPDEYTLQNLTNRRLIDVAVVAPTESGFRVGWLDELPTAVPEKSDKEKEKEKEEQSAPRKAVDPKEKAAEDKKKADALFQDAEAKAKTKDEEIPPLPAEGDATVKARVDQLLNQMVSVTVEQAPRREVINLVTRQARLRYEIDEPTLTKEKIDLVQPTSMKSPNIAARDALADVLGNLGLSYRVTEEGKLFITTAARLADELTNKGKVIEGPPIKLNMSQPRKASDSSYRELTARCPGASSCGTRAARRRGANLAHPVWPATIRAGRADRARSFPAGIHR